MPNQTKTLTAQCYCKSVHFTITLPTPSLPLKTHLCHCSVCRHTHGMLCCFHAELPKGLQPEFIAPSTKDSLTLYKTRSCRRYFCSTCGCHVGDQGNDDDDWVISTSIFEGNGETGEEKIWLFSSHIYDEYTKDGGLASWLPRVGSREMKHWNPDPKTATPEECDLEEQEPIIGPDGEDRLLAQCHCGGVSFTISRPHPERVTHPDLKALVSPRDARKYRAIIDFCSDCRLVTGTQVVAWTFIPASATSPRVPNDLLIGTSKTYRSSDDVLRSFCGVCGATVFYSVEDRKYPDEDDMMLDLAMGIVRAPEGARAEDWVTWKTGKWAFAATGERYDKEFTDALREGMQSWSKEKYGEVVSW